MTAKKGSPTDADLLGVDNALKRAAKSALLLARQTKTPCYVVEDGKIVDIAQRRRSPRVSLSPTQVIDDGVNKTGG